MKTNKTEIVFLLDRSGSMAGLEKVTIGGFNSFLKRQCQHEGETILTTVLFDDEYEILWSGEDANGMILTEQEYYVRGCTALLDAVGKTILDVGARLSKQAEDERPEKVLLVITTDGMENASREFSYQKVKELIHHQQETYHWEFIFMGANIDAAAEARQLGIEKKSAFQFDASEKGVEKMYEMVNEVVTEKRRRSI